MGRLVTDVGELPKDDKRELKKHAAAIHCSNSLSLLQRKISNALLYHAYKDLMVKEEHEITVKQLCRLIGYQGHNHAAIKDAFKGLISTVIEWNIISDETGLENWTASSILASVSLQGPLCYYAYSPRMKQLLHSPSMFGKIDLVIQSRFRSSYGLALYENCIRYLGLLQTKWFDMPTFKKLMGVPQDMYEVFRDFKRRVLDKAIDEVNTYSDLIIAPEYVREGRKVVRVRFSLKERAKKTRLGNKAVAMLNEKILPEALTKELMDDFGFTKEQAQQLQTEFEALFIQEKIAIVQQSKPFQTGKVQNLAGYLLSALKNNYQPSKSMLHEVVDMEEAKLAMELRELTQQVEAIKSDYQVFREQEIHHALSRLSAEEMQTFMQQFNDTAKSTINTVLRLQRHKYTLENVHEAPQIKALLRQFAVRELDFISLSSLEEFAANQTDARRDAWQKLKSFDPDHPLLRANDA